MKSKTHHSPLRHTLRIVSLCMLLTVPAAQLSGSEDMVYAQPARSGFHFAIGVGSAAFGATCQGCDTDFFQDRLNGFSGVLQVGAVATPRLVIAGELLGWIKNDAPVYRRVAGLSVVLMGYPSESSGFFVKGGFGGIRAIAEDDVLIVQTDAFMGITGIGFDLRVGERTMVTPYVNYVRSFGGETWLNGIVSPVVATPNAIQVGTSLTVH